MGNIFKRATKDALGTTFALGEVYECPNTTPDTTTVIIGGVISNTGTATVNAEVVVVISGGATINLIGKDTPIPAGTALSFSDGKVVMQEGDFLKAKGSVAGKLDVMLSVMESS